MKKILIMLFAAFLFACNNDDSTDTTRTDSTIIYDQDNTVNRDTSMPSDTSMNRSDTMMRRN